MPKPDPSDLAHDLLLPTLLFAALGAMGWAVRGCSGFGGMNGCIFAGVLWGAAWWFIARGPRGERERPYDSGWIILALTVGVGVSGLRGWMQWPSFFDGHLQTNYARGQFVPISRTYGFVWLFIAGVPWAGLGACLLAWCGSRRPTRLWEWGLRLGCGIGVAYVARQAFDHLPEVFLPLYKSIQPLYADVHANPNLGKLIRDNRAALTHLGLYLGFLGYELVRRNWRNAVLILTVGVVNGLGWSLCQNWRWAPRLWPQASFNWWRCWESCGGISIGVAYGVAYYLANRRYATASRSVTLTPPLANGAGCSVPNELSRADPCRANPNPNWERQGAYLGLVYGLGLSLKNGLKGWANIYLGNEVYWEHVFWSVLGPLLLLGALALGVCVWRRPLPKDFRGDVFPHAHRLIWLALLSQNVIAQAITGPFANWNEVVFNLYYVLLFCVSAVIVYHFQTRQQARERVLNPL